MGLFVYEVYYADPLTGRSKLVGIYDDEETARRVADGWPRFTEVRCVPTLDAWLLLAAIVAASLVGLSVTF